MLHAQLGMAALAVRLLTFRRWNDEVPYARRFFTAFGVLIAELFIENFFIWAVAASDLRKHSAQEPLQDNFLLLWQGRLATSQIASHWVSLCSLWSCRPVMVLLMPSAGITARFPAAEVVFRHPWYACRPRSQCAATA
jgi:hypothetical protein